MIRPGILYLLTVLAICNFCKQDFASVKRHQWRCKSKIPTMEADENVNTSRNSHAININNISDNHSNCEHIKCACGKHCKGLRGLKSHQRSCRTVKIISKQQNITHSSNDSFDNYLDPYPDDDLPELLEAKPGVNLPKSTEEWDIANAFFHANLPTDKIAMGNIDGLAKHFSSVVYNYFKENFGVKNNSEDSNKEYSLKYKTLSNGQLKSALKKLKGKNASVSEIQYVSKLLRNKLKLNVKAYCETIDHDMEISKHFWGYCKMFIQKPQRVLPSFSMEPCYTFYKKSFWCFNRFKTYVIPSWIPRFNNPTVSFNSAKPTYGEVSKIVKRMKASGSPCPLDQISIITFKRCQYLRTYITILMSEIIKRNRIPTTWRRAITILIHKKGDTKDPSNFRPITLENVCLKIFTSLMRDRLYEFLVANKYIEIDIQKGFSPKLSGTWEHIAQLTNIINKARRQQRSVTITLLDLRNAFGEVSHNLIETTLKYHHVPNDVIDLIKSVYTDFSTCIATDQFVTPLVAVKKGVLQGDSMSPLIFNLVMNTFVQYVKKEHFQQLGYKYFKYLLPRHWMQFADDAVAITGQEYENQILLNAFGRWCAWSDMLIRVDKCHSFGMKKIKSHSKQVQPKLYINNELIPPIKNHESFLYLGRYFDFKMSNKDHMNRILDTVNTNMESINNLPLHPKNKMKLYHRYLLSKISWDLTVAEIPETWLKNNVDNVISSYVRLWFEIPIAGTLEGISLPHSKFGFSFIKISTKALQCRVNFRCKLSTSPNADIRQMQYDSSPNNIKYDQYKSSRDAIKDIRNTSENRILKMLSQGLIMRAIRDHAWTGSNIYWHKALSRLPKNIYSFVTRYLNNTLANGTNLFKWGKAQTTSCGLCSGNETLGHVVAGCKTSLQQLRYNWRHDSVLKAIAVALSPLVGATNMYCDCDPATFRSPSIITGDADRPDLVITSDNRNLLILELTVGYETNLEANFSRKNHKYKHLLKELNKTYNVKYVNLSMGCIGTIYSCSKSIKQCFKDMGMTDNNSNYLITKTIEIAIRCSYYIFCRRGKEWDSPKLLSW